MGKKSRRIKMRGGADAITLSVKPVPVMDTTVITALSNTSAVSGPSNRFFASGASAAVPVPKITLVASTTLTPTIASTVSVPNVTTTPVIKIQNLLNTENTTLGDTITFISTQFPIYINSLQTINTQIGSISTIDATKVASTISDIEKNVATSTASIDGIIAKVSNLSTVKATTSKSIADLTTAIGTTNPSDNIKKDLQSIITMINAENAKLNEITSVVGMFNMIKNGITDSMNKGLPIIKQSIGNKAALNQAITDMQTALGLSIKVVSNNINTIAFLSKLKNDSSTNILNLITDIQNKSTGLVKGGRIRKTKKKYINK
jgi:hypothetical protein